MSAGWARGTAPRVSGRVVCPGFMAGPGTLLGTQLLHWPSGAWPLPALASWRLERTRRRLGTRVSGWVVTPRAQTLWGPSWAPGAQPSPRPLRTQAPRAFLGTSNPPQFILSLQRKRPQSVRGMAAFGPQSPWLGLQSPGRGRRMEVGGNILGRADLMDSVWQGLGHWYDHGLLSPIAPPARAAWATVRTSRRTQVHVLGPFGVCEGSQGALQRRGS